MTQCVGNNKEGIRGSRLRNELGAQGKLKLISLCLCVFACALVCTYCMYALHAYVHDLVHARLLLDVNISHLNTACGI